MVELACPVYHGFGRVVVSSSGHHNMSICIYIPRVYNYMYIYTHVYTHMVAESNMRYVYEMSSVAGKYALSMNV